MQVIYIDAAKSTTLTQEALGVFERNPVDPPLKEGHELIVLQINGVFAAYAKVFRAPENDVLDFLEVSPDFRGRHYEGTKISRMIFAEAFKRCADFSSCLVLTRYTDKGRRSLLPMEDDLAKEYPQVKVCHQPGV